MTSTGEGRGSFDRNGRRLMICCVVRTLAVADQSFSNTASSPSLTYAATARFQPIAEGERNPALDVLRGFALFGVLVAYALWSLGSPPEQTYSEVDRILDQGLSALVDTKAYTLFATMFRLGFSIQLTRATARGVNVVPTYRRRLMALFLIGLVHALVLRNGDILVPYAVMGSCLILFGTLQTQRLSLQVPASVWWLNHFCFGPAEWVWRSLTYGRLQQMRITRNQNAPVSA